MRRYALRDEQWARIEHLLPGRKGHVGVTAKDNRLFVEAVLYRYRAGIPWRDLPERFGDPIKIHTRFSRWGKSGVWEKVFKELAKDADNEYAMIDSTIVRALYALISTVPERSKKRRRPSNRAVAGRVEHQDPRHHRRTRQSDGLLSFAGPGA